MGDRLATIDMSRKERGGLLCPFPWGDLGPRLTQCGMGWGPVPLPKRGTDPPMFGPCLLWPNGCINQDATWYGGRPRPGPHCCRWQLSCPPQGAQQPPLFGPCLLWPNGRPSLSYCWALVALAHQQQGQDDYMLTCPFYYQM